MVFLEKLRHAKTSEQKVRFMLFVTQPEEEEDTARLEISHGSAGTIITDNVIKTDLLLYYTKRVHLDSKINYIAFGGQKSRSV